MTGANMASLPRFHTAVYFATFIAFSAILCVHSLRITDIQEFQDVNGLEDISCEQSLAFGGQKKRLLDTIEKVRKFESSLPRELRELFQQIKSAADSFDVSIFTDKDMKNLLSYLRRNMERQEFLDSLNARQFLTSAIPPMVIKLMMKWIPAFRLLQKPNVMCSINEMIPMEAFGFLCQHLGSFDTTVKQMSIMEDRCAHCTAFFVKQRQDERMTGVLHGGKGRVLYRLIRKVYPDDWDLHMLRLDPGSVKTGDIARINTAHFSDKMQVKMVLANENIWKYFDKRVMAAIGKALLSALGPVSSWSKDNMEMLGQYIMCLSPRKLDEILTPHMFFDIDMRLLHKPMADAFFRIGAWKVVDHFEDPANTFEFNSLTARSTSTVICLALRFAPMKSLFDSLITMNMTKKAMMECMDNDMKDSKLAFLLKKITSDPKFDWSSGELLKMDNLIPLLPPSSLDKITDDDLMDYWTNKMATFDFPLTKAVMKRLKDKFDFKTFKCDQMETLQEGLLTLTREELDAIPLSVYTVCASSYIPYLDTDCHYNPRVCEYIWSLMKRSGEKTSIAMLDLMHNMTGEFMEEFIPAKDMSDIDIGENVDPNDFTDLKDIPMDGTQAKVLYRKLRNTFGNISSHDSEITNKRDALKFFGKGSTVEDLQGLPDDGSLMNVLPEIATDVGRDSRKKFFGKGSTVEDLQGLPDDGSLMSVLPEIATDVGRDSKKKTSVVYDKIHEVLGMGAMTTDDVCIEEEMTDDYAGFFTQASQTDLDKLRPESKKDILRSIGDKEEYVQQMSRPKVQSFFREQIAATGLDRSESITPQDIDNVGPNLFCGMTKDDALKLTSDSIKSFIDTFQQCEHLDQETRGELASKFVEAYGGLKEMLKSPILLYDMSTLLPYIEVAEDLSEREKEKLKLLSDEVQSSFTRRQERLEKRAGRDVPEDEKKAEKSQRSKFNKKLVQLTSKGGDGIDCASLRSFGGEIGFLGQDDIKKMNLSDFKDCLEAFHPTHWDEPQLEAIGSKLKQVFGKDTERWTANITTRVGPLIKALDESDIGKMDFSKDQLAYLGHFDIGGNQSSSIVRKFMKDKSMGDAGDITSDLLGSFGKLMCGFTPDDIKHMNATSVMDAATRFADVDCLDEDQLDAIMKKLEEKLGADWSKLEPDRIEEFGILMGGAPEDVLASLKEDQLASIDGKALERIPPRRFAKAFGADKLLQLSDEQAMYLQPEHMWKMDKTQRQALGNLTKKSGFTVPKAKHDGVDASSTRDFQKGRNLPRSSCGSTLAFAGQRDELLDTPKKVAAFEGNLKGDALAFFKELVSSDDHSIDQFTADEMRNTLKFLMDSVSEEDREDFMSIVDNFEFVSADSLRAMLEEWPPSIHLLQKPEVMCKVTGLLNEELLKTFCDRIVGSDVSAAVTTEVMERCADCAVLRYIDRENHKHMPRLEDAKASVFMRKIRQMNIRDWDLNALAIAPEALKPEDIDNIEDLSHFKNVTKLEVFMDDDVACCLSKEVKKKIASKLRTALGPLSSWSEEVTERVGQFVPFLSDMESELTGDVVMKNLDHLKVDDDVSQEEKKTLTTASWNLADYILKNRKTITEEQKMKSFCLLAKFPPKQATFDSIYDTEEIRKGLRNCSDWKVDQEMSVRAVSKISQAQDHKWGSEDMQMLREFPSGVTPAVMDTIDVATLLEHWNEIKEADFSMPVLRSAWNKLKKNYTLATISCEKLEDMGKMFFALSLKEIDSIPGASLGDCVAYLSRVAGHACEEERKSCDKMWSKIERLTSEDKNRTKSRMIRKLDPGFLRFVPADAFKNMSITDLGGIDAIGEMDLDPIQAEAVIEIVEREKGAISRDNLNYTGRHIEKLGSVFAKGASVENLENLPEGPELLDTLPEMKRNMKSMKDEKVEAVYGKLQKMFGMDSDQPVCLDESTVKLAAGFFSKASREDLKKLDADTRKSILSEIGKDRDTVKTMSRQKVREQFLVLKETENFDGKSTITDDDVDKYGANLLCGMEKEDVPKLSDKMLKEHITELDRCEQLDQETRKEIADKYVSASNGITELLKKPKKLKEMGSLVFEADLPDTEAITNDQKEALKSVAGDMMTEVNARKERLSKRSDNEIPPAEKTEEQFKRSEFARKLWETVSDSVDCSTIKSFDGDLEFMDVTDIEGMGPGVVTECLDEFQHADWDEEQLKAFGGKIKKSFGNDTAKWNKDRVMRTGKLLSGLDSDDIGKITLDEDVMGVIGESEVAEPEKMFKKFKKDAGISNMSSVDSDTLRGLGKMVCAMEPQELKDLPGDVVKDVISELGEKECLNEKQRDVINKKYQDSVTDKELAETDIASLGVFAGGLPEDQLRKLDEEQLSRITPDAIKKMKPEKFANTFTADKMGKFTKEQLSALDAKALRNMDVSQLIALENVDKGRKDVDAQQLAKNKTKRFHIDIPEDTPVQSLETFQEVRNLPSDNCGGVSFAGQSDNRLDTPTKRHTFNSTLPEKQAVMFGRILASPDHDVSQFTTFEMKKMLKYLTNEMTEDDQDVYIELKTEFASLTPEDLNETLHTLPPNLYLLMKPRLMCGTLGQMDVESLDTFCVRLTSRDVTTATFIEVLNRCGDCLAIAHAHRTDEDIIGLMKGFKGKAFYDKLRQWKPSGWDVYHLMFAPDSLEVKDIRRITDLDHFKDIGQIARLADPQFYEKVPKPVMEMLAKNLHRALGSFSGWSFIENNMLLPYILNFPSKILEEEMKVTMVLSILSNIEDIMEMASNKFMSVSAWKITDYLVKKSKSVPKDIKKKVFCLVLKYTNHKKLWKRVYSTSEIFECLPECGFYDIPDEAITNLIRKVVLSKSFSWDQEGFEVLGEFIAAVPIPQLKRVDPDLLYQNWDALSHLDFSFGKLRSLWKVIKSKVSLKHLTCDEIKHLGRALLVMHSKEIEKIPDESMSQCAPYIAGMLQDACKERSLLCKTMWKKIKAYAKENSIPIGSVIKDLGKGFLQHIPREDIEIIDIDDMGGVDSLSHLEPSQDQAPVFMRKIKENLGPVTKDNTNYTSEAVVKMGPVFYYGATGSEFEILPEDSSLLEMLPDMAKYFNDLNEKKIEIIFKKLKKIFAVDSSDNICLDRALTEQIAMFFTAARADDLKKFSDETKKVIFQTLGGKYEYINKMSRSKVQELFSVLMDTDSLGSKSSYEDEDIGNYKYMWCGQKDSQAKRLSKEAVDGHMNMIKDCVHLEPDTRESLVGRTISVSGSLTDLLTSNPKRLEDLGSLVISMDSDQLKTLDPELQEVFLSSVQKLMESVTEVQREAEKRPAADISKDEIQQDKTKLNKFTRAVYDMYLTSSLSEERRRKRSTTPVDCPTIQSFNGALSFLTADEIAAMESDEFEDCLEEFQSTEWEDAQLGAFQTQLVTSFGSDTSVWTQENVLACGILLDSLDSTQVTSLTVLDDDAISSLGSNVFTKNAPYIMDTYLTTQNITDLSSVDADTLGNAGNLICGFNTSQMADMESSTIDGASSDLNSVSCLDSDQLTTLGNKIVEIRGTDWTDSTSDEISSLGVLAAGLPASVLEDIGTDELSSLSPEAVENMSPETFANVFTAEKIGSLSSAQANSLTDEQKAQLSDDQLSAVSYVATTTTDNENGAARHSINVMTALVLVVIPFIIG